MLLLGIEVDERILDDTVFNNIWCESSKVFDKGVTSEMLKRILNSDFVRHHTIRLSTF